ncbi:hypothetical protein [Aestuariivivens sediminis]|uniref:hypothetical protein n=1 Tax=Aestuariivivens sediminis TaxID=2913557 RepID=UPI001F55BA3D|nr:hypothetical protein [Aestuariivivens sediminis]
MVIKITVFISVVHPIMKILFQTCILILITSCGSLMIPPDLVFEQKFNECTNEKYIQLAGRTLPKDTLLFKKTHIHNLLENKLIVDGFLEEISKKGYLNLLDKSMTTEFFHGFENEIGFDPYFLFPENAFISCYSILDDKLNLFDENSWQFRFVHAYNQYEAHGDMDIKSPYLKAALEKIPEIKFQNIIYRKLFLDLIYKYYN